MSNPADMSNQQLMAKGRKEINETGKTLDRIERVAEDTLQVGVSVSSLLSDAREAIRASGSSGSSGSAMRGNHFLSSADCTRAP
jgi:hypothetical protein